MVRFGFCYFGSSNRNKIEQMMRRCLPKVLLFFELVPFWLPPLSPHDPPPARIDPFPSFGRCGIPDNQRTRHPSRHEGRFGLGSSDTTKTQMRVVWVIRNHRARSDFAKWGCFRRGPRLIWITDGSGPVICDVEIVPIRAWRDGETWRTRSPEIPTEPHILQYLGTPATPA